MRLSGVGFDFRCASESKEKHDIFQSKCRLETLNLKNQLEKRVTVVYGQIHIIGSFRPQEKLQRNCLTMLLEEHIHVV